MNRLAAISNQIVPPPEPAIYFVNTDASFFSKLQNILPHLFSPVWLVSPLFCLYKLFVGSLDTKIDLFLVLVYQYFFHRKTQTMRNVYRTLRGHEFFDGYQLIFEDSENSLKQSNTMFSFHPHGILCYGLNIAAQMHPLFETAEVVGSRMSFNLPWGGLVMKFYGVEGANPQNFAKLLNEKKNIMFVPGGFEEATITRYGKDRVFIKHRKGFIKMALKYGYTIHPCYTFGENKLYYTYTNQTMGLFLNKLKMPGLLAFSKNIMLPNNDVKLYTIVGKGIKIPTLPNPTKENVDKYHKIYIESLVELYDKWKGICGGNEQLEVL